MNLRQRQYQIWMTWDDDLAGRTAPMQEKRVEVKCGLFTGAAVWDGDEGVRLKAEKDPGAVVSLKLVSDRRAATHSLESL